MDPGHPYSQYLNHKDPEAPLLMEAEYYNLGNNIGTLSNHPLPDMMDYLLWSLDGLGYKYRLRQTSEVGAHDKGINRLEQIFMASEKMINRARSFCVNFMVLFDDTFRTNSLNLPLVYLVGLNNKRRAFTVAMSFTRSESTTAFTFVLDCLDQVVFYQEEGQRNKSHPKVLISDQTPELRKAILEHPSGRWNTIIHQLCQYHMYQDIRAFIQNNRQTRNTAEELNNVFRAILNVIRCSRVNDLDEKRLDMYQLMEPEERKYYEYNWRAERKEERVLEAYVRGYPNRGCVGIFGDERRQKYMKRFLDNLSQTFNDSIQSLQRIRRNL
ncbi:Similar to Protein FAR1-RELATED SEQUENCE 12; acc. no. Q3E7I5 [Pyronema omphalodes CBS 100304]|uniref:Similar to Protein FAR1-RELATED SEQUENCE 12 acc. no. Q3E7I5 n=1 Tax=Pyronema omphalodes (strain CBS 100304) TaxID=1076935 RepID=U4LR67_PYROM|nr:Similar to Protein FAR1-RELATED SEQUENCE 12; acc. no. Q3E7I5 [Pyronema omphalodes CBS 100304]